MDNAYYWGKTTTPSGFMESWLQVGYELFTSDGVLPGLMACCFYLESGYGNTELALKANNYGGINYYDDSICAEYKNKPHYTINAPQEHDGKIIYKPEDFIIFSNSCEEGLFWLKWMTRSNANYKALHYDQDGDTMEKAIHYLHESPYATSSTYEEKLLRIYKQYKDMIDAYNKAAIEKVTRYKKYLVTVDTVEHSFKYEEV